MQHCRHFPCQTKYFFNETNEIEGFRIEQALQEQKKNETQAFFDNREFYCYTAKWSMSIPVFHLNFSRTNKLNYASRFWKTSVENLHAKQIPFISKMKLFILIK